MATDCLVFAALRFEASAVGTLANLPGWQVARTGVGPANAERRAEEWIDVVRPRRLIGIGLCGGLAPSARQTDVVLPREVVDGQTRDAIVLQQWPVEFVQALQRRLGEATGKPDRAKAAVIQGGRMLSVATVAATPEVKASLHAEYEASWVDQETYSWAKCAERRDIPFYAVRVVLDTQTDELPSWKRPGTWLPALTLPWNAVKTRRILSHIGRELACARW